jgi:signal transduction histidine kinase
VARTTPLKKFLVWWRRRRITPEENERQRRRILFVERRIIWPTKLVVMVLSYVLWRQLYRGEGVLLPDINAEELETTTRLFGCELFFYLIGNLVFAVPLIIAFQVHFGVNVVRWSSFLSAVLDNLFLSALIHVTGTVQPQAGGFNSVLYWVYCGIMVRNAIYFPVIYQQALINLSVIGSYMLALYLAEGNSLFMHSELFRLRISVLVLVGVCCWGIQILSERQRRRDQQRQEMLLRSEKMHATGRLAAEVAHQLKNPLSIINNAAFNLQRNLERGKPVSDDTIQIIRQEVQRADRILTDLMNYSGLSEGRIEAVNVNEVLDTALKTRLPAGLDSKITLRKDLEEDLPPIFAQRRWLEECFLNLVVNAVEAMPTGGTLTLRSRSDPMGFVTVEVQDTGAGIAMTDLVRIFEPFFTTKKGGTGLGLAIVKNIVETYGGRITVKSDAGRGAHFTVELPLRTEQVEISP